METVAHGTIRLMRVCGPLLIATSVLVVPNVAGAQATELARARNALKSLGYSEARTLLETALTQGGHTHAELLEIYALRGEVEAVLDGPEAGEREFRKLLVLDPKHPPPERETPTFMVPFENARQWARAAGSLRVEHAPPSAQPDDRDFELVERIVSDPLAMVAGTQVFYRGRDATAYARLATAELRQKIPISPVGATYYIQLVDRWGNVVATIGTPAAPLSVAAQPAAETEAPLVVPTRAAPAPRGRWYKSPAAWSLIGIGVAGLAGASALFGESENAVDAARAANTRDQYLAAHNRSVAFDAAGGAVMGAGGVMVTIGVALLINRAVRLRAPASRARRSRAAVVVMQGGP
jgi:hypothetical protein